MTKEELQTLFTKYHEGTASNEERAQLEAWYLQYNEDHALGLGQRTIEAAQAQVFRRLPGNETEFLKIGIRLAAAAVLIGILVVLTFLLLNDQKQASNRYRANDIPPGRNKAILTLPSGKRLDLNPVNKGQVITAGGIKVIEGAVRVSYTDSGDGNEQHTISTPNGGQWQVRLSDGTDVWLNAASSLSFPASFNSSVNRIVTLNGEGYFEVAKDEAHPFIVLSGDQRVEVLGTHFNISGYTEDQEIRTTLAEGKVKVSLLRGSMPQILKPGEQAVTKDQAIDIRPVDPAEVLAWKNGYFQFDNEPIRQIMPKLARWYDVDINYEGNLSSEGLNGKVSRNNNISQVIKALAATCTVHFKVEGRRVTVIR